MYVILVFYLNIINYSLKYEIKNKNGYFSSHQFEYMMITCWYVYGVKNFRAQVKDSLPSYVHNWSNLQFNFIVYQNDLSISRQAYDFSFKFYCPNYL